jgi:hypothetical protein
LERSNSVNERQAMKKAPKPLPCVVCGKEPEVFWLEDYIPASGKCWCVECPSARCKQFWARRSERGKAIHAWNKIIRAHHDYHRLLNHT